MTEQEYENRRRSFRPDVVRMLLIGESRPQNGTFFFNGDSRLTKYTSEAFSIEYGSFSDVFSFLNCFKNLGCYLVDICVEPINGLSNSIRNKACIEGESTLAAVLSELRPQATVVVKKSIAPSVDRALKHASLNTVPKFLLPFPAQGHEREYVQQLATVLAALREERVLGDRC